MRGLLDALISKLKYDESYDFESQGEEEVMFIEFRKQLKVLFDAIAQVVRFCCNRYFRTIYTFYLFPRILFWFCKLHRVGYQLF